MAYDEGLAQRIREVIGDRPDVTEKKMFGGLSFLLSGNMSVGVVGDDMVARIPKDEHEAALAEDGVRAMDFTGRPMKGWVYVDTSVTEQDEGLSRWVGRGVAFAASLPPK